MVAGYGAYEPVPANQDTYSILLKGCHEAGALEKALEVLSWMHSTSVKPTAPIYAALQDTINIAALWDAKVLAANGEAPLERKDGSAPGAVDPKLMSDKLHNAILPQDLRPAPHNGLRSLYIRNPRERLHVRLHSTVICSSATGSLSYISI